MSSENIGGIEQGRLIPGHVYELDNGELGHFFGPGHANNRWPSSLPKPIRDLTISAETPITASDAGRWAAGPGEPCTHVRDNRASGFADAPFAGCVGCAPDGTTVAPAWSKGRGRVPYITRWLSRAECKARGLDAQHPTQRWDEPARKPGEFRVGDRVRVTRTKSPCNQGDTGEVRGHSRFGKEVIGIRFDFCRPGAFHSLEALEPGLERCEEGRGWFLLTKELELIEPAREGEPCTTPPAGLPTPQESSPPAPSDSVEYFRSVLWPEAPPAFPLGQRVEPEVRRELCPCCRDNMALRANLIRPCPECEGSGWQEVK